MHMLDSARSIMYTQGEIDAVVDAMTRADPLTQGKYQVEFEQKLEQYVGVKKAFAVSSCTSALELAAILCDFKPGDEVIIPAHTFCATAIPFIRAGARIKWADININTWTVDADKIEPLITDRTRAIVPVHLYGLMAEMPEIMGLAYDNDILVVEDCAQSIGASINGKQSGSFGDFACFSFHQHKNITTLGEGGALIVRDEDKAKLVPGLRHNGIRPFTSRPKVNVVRDVGIQDMGDIPFETCEEYWRPAMSNVDLDLDCVLPYNFCMGEVQCALGTKLLDRVDQLAMDKNDRARRFISAMGEYPELRFQYVPPGYKHNYHLLPSWYDGRQYKRTSHDFIREMAFVHNVKCIVQYYPLYRYPLFKKMGFGEADVPISDALFDNMVSFPFHHWMSAEDFTHMVFSTLDTLDKLRGVPYAVRC